MKTPSKWFRREKKDFALLEDTDGNRSPDFNIQVVEQKKPTNVIKKAVVNTASDEITVDESRDESSSVNKIPSSWPYQIASVVPPKNEQVDAPERDQNSAPLKNEKDEASAKEQEEKQKPASPVSLKIAASGGSKFTWDDNSWSPVVLSTSRESQKLVDASENGDQVVSPISLSSKSESSGDDIFDDLESVFETVEEDEKFLNDFLRDRSSVNGAQQSAFSISMNSASKGTGEKSGSNSDVLSSLISPESSSKGHFVSKKGILIVDPNQNGAVYHMDEDNKSLTDKDLLIIGHNPKGNRTDDQDDQDDSTVMSSLTEVTYQKTKEERVKLIMKHLTDAASITESRAWCKFLSCTSASHDEDDDVVANTEKQNELKNQKAEKKIRKTKEGTFSLTQDGGALLKSLVGAKVDYGSFDEKIIVCITRIYLALVEGGNDNGLRCTYNEPKLSHDLGVKLIEGSDGQALVAEVTPESTAERSGVKIGDNLSFAVPLNNTFQGYERACDFISRLELIGMRTSYRELFDMFLSKTSSGWPVAIVFRRQSEGMHKVERLPLRLQSMNMNIDILRATSCLHELVTFSREYDYMTESNGINEIVRGNIESFIPRPHYRTVKNIRIGSNKPSNGPRIPFMPTDVGMPMKTLFSQRYRRNSLVSWYTENSVAILYMRISSNYGGSGIIVSRTGNGSWSAPCAIIGTLPSGAYQFGCDEIDCLVFLRSKKDINSFRGNKQLEIDCISNGANFVAITKFSKCFQVESRFRCIVETKDDLNTAFYVGVKKLSVERIIEGAISQPDQAASLFGALRRLEFPSTMYPHPTPPINLTKYTSNDWEKQSSCQPSESLEHPFDEEEMLTLRNLLRVIESNTDQYREDKTEIDMFMLKFCQMLFDGVTVERMWEDDSNTTKYLLKLFHLQSDSWDCATLQLISRSESLENDLQSSIDFRHPFLNTELSVESFKLHSISRISQNKETSTNPSNIMHENNQKKKKRYVSLEMSEGTKIMLLARTGKDAALLSCGLKLLVEHVQINL